MKTIVAINLLITMISLINAQITYLVHSQSESICDYGNELAKAMIQVQKIKANSTNETASNDSTIYFNITLQDENDEYPANCEIDSSLKDNNSSFCLFEPPNENTTLKYKNGSLVMTNEEGDNYVDFNDDFSIVAQKCDDGDHNGTNNTSTNRTDDTDNQNSTDVNTTDLISDNTTDNNTTNNTDLISDNVTDTNTTNNTDLISDNVTDTNTTNNTDLISDNVTDTNTTNNTDLISDNVTDTNTTNNTDLISDNVTDTNDTNTTDLISDNVTDTNTTNNTDLISDNVTDTNTTNITDGLTELTDNITDNNTTNVTDGLTEPTDNNITDTTEELNDNTDQAPINKTEAEEKLKISLSFRQINFFEFVNHEISFSFYGLTTDKLDKGFEIRLFVFLILENGELDTELSEAICTLEEDVDPKDGQAQADFKCKIANLDKTKEYKSFELSSSEFLAGIPDDKTLLDPVKTAQAVKLGSILDFSIPENKLKLPVIFKPKSINGDECSEEGKFKIVGATDKEIQNDIEFILPLTFPPKNFAKCTLSKSGEINCIIAQPINGQQIFIEQLVLRDGFKELLTFESIKSNGVLNCAKGNIPEPITDE